MPKSLTASWRFGGLVASSTGGISYVIRRLTDSIERNAKGNRGFGLMGQNSETVSAIIPVYNGRNRVRDAIESALSQTQPVLEVIVVDDGSSDGTIEVLKKYPVKIIRQANGGPGSARNAGAGVAQGEWLAFLDHDDTWRAEKTARQLVLGREADVGVIYSAREGADEAPMSWEALWERNIIGTPSGAMVRRQCFLDVGGFDERRILIGTEDHHLWLRIALTKWRFIGSQEMLFDYKPERNSLSNQLERMAMAEWASFEDIGRLAGLSEKTIRKRKAGVSNHYIREFIGIRNMTAARGMISTTSVGSVSPDLLIAAFSPAWLLNVRKNCWPKFLAH
jgi:glycosyltransferase involved in cell wall biosynthesis